MLFPTFPIELRKIIKSFADEYLFVTKHCSTKLEVSKNSICVKKKIYGCYCRAYLGSRYGTCSTNQIVRASFSCEHGWDNKAIAVTKDKTRVDGWVSCDINEPNWSSDSLWSDKHIFSFNTRNIDLNNTRIKRTLINLENKIITIEINKLDKIINMYTDNNLLETHLIQTHSLDNCYICVVIHSEAPERIFIL